MGVAVLLLAFLGLLLIAGCGGGGMPPAGTITLHQAISTTYFWVGEPATGDNGYITNTVSAWDDQWMQHYGGADDPANRNGYWPAGFTPQENPFYCALPYNDFGSNGNRRATASTVVPWANTQSWGPTESMCKNHWVRISANGKTAYAQWEDVGPFGENDSSYVFGAAQPSSATNDHAGLDVSPAVHEYLGLGDVSLTDWQFVNAASVPSGPWTQIITTAQIDWSAGFSRALSHIAP
jgi:hypothetical protein